MAQENNNMVYSIKTLTIPDYVLPMDVPKIINWFDYYNIANVKNVDIREHPEPEYYVEDKPYYGYAVIEIDEWYKNNRETFSNVKAKRGQMLHYKTYQHVQYNKVEEGVRYQLLIFLKNSDYKKHPI